MQGYYGVEPYDRGVERDYKVNIVARPLYKDEGGDWNWQS